MKNLLSKFAGGIDKSDDPPIEFVCDEKYYSVVPEPTPAYNELPQWYKDTPMVAENGTYDTSKIGSVRRCMSFFESLSMGWILKTPGDIEVNIQNGEMSFDWDMDLELVSNQSTDLMNSTYPEDIVLIKLATPWRAVAKEGWSLLVVPPLNRPAEIFESTAGVLNADEFDGRINSIVKWHDLGYSGIIKKGTPISQLIPIKRTEHTDGSNCRPSTEEEDLAKERHYVQLASDRHTYREQIWEPIHRG